jgi:hypothetical protein
VTPCPKKNVAASVRDLLMQLSRTRQENFNFVLDRYARERLLYRLSQSHHASAFVLKGATLFTLWFGHPHRATRDIDLLGTGAPDLDRLVGVFRDLCALAVDDDGMVFDPATVSASRIKEDATYEGVRVQLIGTLGSAVLNLQVDVGFGDTVTPLPRDAHVPRCSAEVLEAVSV